MRRMPFVDPVHHAAAAVRTTASSRRWSTVRMAVIATLISVGLTASAVPDPARSDAAGPRYAPVLKTADGWLRGLSAGGADRFLGVPYAAPPIKNLRFRPPQPPVRWQGVRDATRQAPACLQFQPTGVREDQAVSEDCLYLDVYRPSRTQPGARLPVLVWYHGGGWTQGTGVIYGGQTMAALTHSIVISINYRLGPLGFLALPELDAENPRLGSGNYATLDQIEALRWTRRTIAAFGGDPGLVTVYGQSAGAGAVCTLLTSPLSRGLFSRAIIQSLPCGAATQPLAQAEQTGRDYARAAGCTDLAAVLTCLRSAWAPNLIAAEQHVLVRGEVYGTGVLPENSATALAAGRWNKVPAMIGNVRSEGKLFVIDRPQLTAAQYVEQVRATYGANADAVLARYPLAAYPAPFYALAAVTTDSGIACGVNATANLLAPLTRTYRYEFNDPTSPTLYGFQPAGIDMSNAHSAELAYLFDFTLGDRPLTSTQQRLSRQMMRYWAAFARTGDPNVPGQTAWPQFTRATHQTLVLRPTGNNIATTIAEEHHCAFWARITG
jgi:para-nitrobenzyl esterase